MCVAACTGTPSNIDDSRVYFAFDSAEITDSMHQDLKAQSRYMKKHPDVNIVVAGHCDERGSSEYNLALGALRAGNATQVLLHNGIEKNRIETISYGKEKPQYLGSGEKVWAKNRNATTTVKK